MKQEAAVLFDLDGTLVDSAPDLAASVGYALAGVDKPAPALEDIRAYVGEGAARLLHRSLTGSVDGVAEESLFLEASRLFFDHYARNVCVDSTIYPGVVETLDRMLEEGCRFACVTNKPRRFTRALLEAIGLAGFFPVCVSGDSLPHKKPDPAPLLFAATALETGPQSCTMVGDTPTDVMAAKNAGMTIVAVDYGYGRRNAIEAAAPDYIVGAFSEVIGCLPRSGTVC